MNDEGDNRPLRAVIYARVSPTKHVKSEEGLHASLQEAIEICKEDIEKERNVELIDVYQDEYVSGKSSKNMEQFQKMMQDARDGKFDRVYCRKVHRFGRNRNDMLRSEIELSELGISIKFVEDGIDTSKPFGKSIMAVLSDLAEMDREQILENTKKGRERAIQKGVKFGRNKKDFNVRSIRYLRKLPPAERPTWKDLAKDFNVSVQTMINRLKEEGYWDYENKCVK